MSQKSVLCIAPSLRQANQIVDCLRAEGFFSDDISAVFPETARNPDARHTRGPAGAVPGGALGWLTGVGARTVSGDRTLVATGPLAALGSAAPGGTIELMADVLSSLGVPERDSRRYVDRLNAGAILLSVHAEDPGEIKRAREIFEQARAQDISAICGSRVPLHSGATQSEYALPL